MNDNINRKVLSVALAGAWAIITNVGLAADAGTTAPAFQAGSGKLDGANIVMGDVVLQPRAGTTYAAAGPVAVLPAANVDTLPSAAAPALQDGGVNLDDVRMKIGEVDVHPHFGTAFTYDDNLTIAQGSSKKGGFYALATPGVQFQYGKAENTISLDYQAGIQRFFGNRSSMDTVDHNVMLTGVFSINERWRLNVAQGFSRAMGGETRDQFGSPTGQIGERVPGTRTEIQNYTTVISTEYDISKKTAIGAELSMSFSDYVDSPGLVGNNTYNIRVPFYYHISSKTDVFIAADGGTSAMEQGADQTYGGFDIGARTRLTGKINGSVRAGYQHRDFDGNISSVDTVVASASADWAITPHTTLVGSINRNVNPAASAINNYYEGTFLDLMVYQKMWHNKVTLSGGGGYERDDYGKPFATFTGSGGTGDRSDDYYYLKVGCDYTIRKWWSAGANYRFRSNVSSLSSYNFDNNLVSIYTRVSF